MPARPKHPVQVLRELRGESLRALARRAGLGKSFLHDVEHGHRALPAKRLEQLARALDCSVDDLRDDHGDD